LQVRGVARRDSIHALTWTAVGTIKVTGEVDVGTVRIEGSLSVAGPITSDSFVARGRLDAGGSITISGAFTTDGSFRATGPVQAQEAAFSGTTRISRDVIVAGSVTMKGQFAAAAVRAGEFHGDGAVIVPGGIDAVSVDVRIRRDSRFGTLRAHSVRLLRSPPNPIEWVFGRSPPPRVARIEADRVELEGVDVGFVRCPEVILGRDAHVTELEGTVVRRHSSARVGPRSKSPPPYGLSR